jgi:hypothetical protein
VSDTISPFPRVALAATLGALLACGSGTPATTTDPSGTASTPPVYVVLFTHIEDNTPAGVLGSAANRANYLALRARLIEMAALARSYNMRWSLEPDWNMLLAALLYEDASITTTTNGLNVFRYLRDNMSVAIDPHSHEGGGYNYTDVAHLLDSLGVGGSTVIGGHIWDPTLPQFQQWDRFRVPVAGLRFPSATWRGDILMGSGTPNHVNDPVISGVWRPKSRTSYFEDDPAGNISCIGAYKGDVAGISELVARYRNGQQASTCMLTASIAIRPVDITAASGLTTIENSVLKPLAVLRDSGQVKLTDFTSLIATWKQQYASKACTYQVTTGFP